MNFLKQPRRFLPALLTIFAFMLVACGTSVAEPEAEMEEMEHSEGEDHGDMEEMDHDEDMEEMDHEDGGDHSHDDAAADRIPNEGNSVEILEPADGAAFANGEAVTVKVAFDNFAYGEDGNHWHIYINGSSYGMVVGLNVEETVRGLEPGTHEVVVVMANGDHIEFEDGASITITVEE